MINFKDEIVKTLKSNVELSESEIEKIIEIPPDYNMGDFAFPVFSLAKIYKKNPAMIANEIVEKIGGNEYFEKIETKGAYINFFVDKNKLSSTVLQEVLERGEDYGKINYGDGKVIIMEYSSTNIAKPFHIGHIRSTVIGDSLKKIHRFLGYKVVGINHIGDYGTQFGMLICAYKKWGSKEEINRDPIPELLKLYIRINEEASKDEELMNECRTWFKKLEDGDSEALEIWQWFRDVSLKEFNRVYKMLDIDFDSYDGESFYSDKMAATVELMEEKNILEESDGAKIVNLEDKNLPPALIIKSDGSTIYLTRDVTAAIYRKNHYNFHKNIYVVGSQQNLHFQQLFAILDKMGYEWAKDCVHVAFGMVSLEDGTLSTRRGKVLYLEDVLNKATEKVLEILEGRNDSKDYDKEELAKMVGIGAVKFQELFNQRIKDYVFDWDRTLSFEGETGPYVQYVHARICSLLSKGNFKVEDKVDTSLLNSEEEVDIIRNLYNFTNVVVDSHIKLEPYFITRYVVELAKNFNKFYSTHQVVSEDEELTKARLALCYGVKTVIASGLALLGIKAPERM